MKPIQIIRKILQFINLESELENPEIIHEEIEKGIIFKGTNLWILIFAIIVASVGLNMNSTAVIIGAMLISPLMGPINGIGYSIATYDLDLFSRSVKNFSFSVIASIIASTIYFALSPVSTAHSELLARTSPTIYDVLIALFGGFAGIVAISSKLKGNVIPGVAIATALMPPLCTAGYGLATGQFNFFFGAFYLFLINSIFIAMASVWISQILKFPIRSVIDTGRKKRINRMITLVITIVLLPSIYFGYQLVQQEKFNQNANLYVSNISLFEGNFLLRNKISAKDKTINLIYGGNQLTDEQKKTITDKAADFGLTDTRIVIDQGMTFASADEKNIEVYSLKEQIFRLNSVLGKKDAQLDSIRKNSYFGKVILDEISNIYPEISGCTYSESYAFTDKSASPELNHIVFLTTEKSIAENEREKISGWLKIRLNTSKLIVIFENE